ncbi:hypothetical protein L9F63_016773, partial [Diploptera punctata]
KLELCVIKAVRSMKNFVAFFLKVVWLKEKFVTCVGTMHYLTSVTLVDKVFFTRNLITILFKLEMFQMQNISENHYLPLSRMKNTSKISYFYS